MNDKTPAILLLVFNRPDLTKKVFQAIREIRPEKLFIAADGPRAGNPEDALLCKETRAISEQIDWDCDLKTLFRDTNLGLKESVENAISWFFTEVDKGIILEDDCLPSRDFFRFCGELLEKYKDDAYISVISGNDLRQHTNQSDGSYYFSHYGGCWGWATWRRAWHEYLPEIPPISSTETYQWLATLLKDQNAATYWSNIFLKVGFGSINSWAYRWLYSQWRHERLAISPCNNLVTNIGFDSRGTHTKVPSSHLANQGLGEITFPLKHVMHRDSDCIANDRCIESNTFKLSPDNSIKSPQSDHKQNTPMIKTAITMLKSRIKKLLKNTRDQIAPDTANLSKAHNPSEFRLDGDGDARAYIKDSVRPSAVKSTGSKAIGNLERYFNKNTAGPGIWKWRHYFDAYEEHFGKFRNTSPVVVEIGVFGGGSLGMWSEYFGDGCRIHGVDINPNCSVYAQNNITVHIGNQEDPDFWASFLKQVPYIDLVIDDGGHSYPQQKTTLECLLPAIRDGGVYLCEDIVGVNNQFASYLMAFVDELNRAQFDSDTNQIIHSSPLQQMVQSVNFYPMLAVIKKNQKAIRKLEAPRIGTKWELTF
jgi:hypothetical protein